MVVACPRRVPEAKSIRGHCPKYFWTNCVRNDLDWRSLFRNYPTPSRSWTDWRVVVYVDIYQNSNFATAKGHQKLHVQITFYYRGNQQDLGFYPWCSCMDSQELCETSRTQNFVGFQKDVIEIPCIVQKGLLWNSAQSHPNKVLIRFRACFDQATIKTMETVRYTFLGGHTPRTVFMQKHRAIMVKYMQGWAGAARQRHERVVSDWTI